MKVGDFPGILRIRHGQAPMMFSLFQTVLLWKLNPHHWLYSYLSACADNGGHAPAELSPFLPWQMSEQRIEQLAKPMPARGCPVAEQPHTALAP